MAKCNQKNHIETKHQLIETLTIKQLLTRWNNRYSLENIYEIANQGYFGVYFRLPQERKIYLDIEGYLNDRLTKSPNKTHYIALKNEFHKFISTYPLLLEEKSGYARLATPVEEKIIPRCTTGSINSMIRGRKIAPIECNCNTFGFVKENNKYVTNSYYRNLDKNFCSEENCFVFIDQINLFEKQAEFKNLRREIRKNKSCIKGTNTSLYKVCELEYRKLVNAGEKNISSQKIWEHLQKLSDSENGHPVIIEVIDWGKSNAKIAYKSHRKQELTVCRRRFENIISTIRTNLAI